MTNNTHRAGRYAIHQPRPDLIAAAEDLGLTNVRYRKFTEGEFVTGYDARGEHRMLDARTMEPINGKGKMVQGSLF